MNPTEFLLWESSSRDTIDFKKVYVDMTGDLAAGLLLSQVVYWHLPNAQGASKLRVEKDGHLWIAKQWDRWWAEVRLTEKQAIRAGEILISLKIAEKQVYKFAGERTVHLRLNWDVFLPLWKATLEKPEEERNAEPGTRTKRPELPRRPKAPNGSRKLQLQPGETPGGDLQNAEREFSKTPKGSFAKHPKGVTENAESGFSYTENTPEITTESGGVLDVVGDPREVAQPTAAPVVEPSLPLRTTFSASPSTHEAMPLTPALGTPVTSPAVVPDVAVLEPPVGGAAVAAEGEDSLSPEEYERYFGGMNDQATDTEDVPGGGAVGAAPAAEAPRGALLAPVALGVAHLVPVPRDELLSRPVAPLDSEQMRTIRTMVTGKLIRDGLLNQLTPTGGLSREDWLRLTLEELELVKRAAQADAKAEIGGFTTQVIDGLDRMIGGGQKAKAQHAGVHGGGALAPAKKPEVDMTPEEGRYRVGACWRCKKTGREVIIVGTAEVKNRHGAGACYVLDDKQRLPALNLVLGYEFVGQTGGHA